MGSVLNKSRVWSLWLISFLVRLRTYQHPCNIPSTCKAPKEIHAILTETLACFLPGQAKDLSALLRIIIFVILHCTRERERETVDGEAGKWQRICFNSAWKTSPRSNADNTESIFRLERLSTMIYSRLFQMACAGVDPPKVSRAGVARSTLPPHPSTPSHTRH